MKKINLIILVLFICSFILNGCARGGTVNSMTSSSNTGSSSQVNVVSSNVSGSNTSSNSKADSSTVVNGTSSKTGTTGVSQEKVTEFRLEDFGGAADGKTDNCEAAKKIVTKLKYTLGKKRIVLGAGTYRFNPSSYTYAFSLTGTYDVEFAGQGPSKTKILIANPNAGFIFINNGKNLAVKGFSLDFETLPFTQGTIVAVDRNNLTYDLKIDKGFGLPTQPWFTEEASGRNDLYRTTHLMDAKTRNYKANVMANFSVEKQVTDLGNGVYRFKILTKGMFAYLGKDGWANGQIQVGDAAVIVMRMGAPHLIYFDSCENTLLENIDLFCAAGFALTNINTSGTAVARNINVKRKDNRLVSMCADAINFTACRAKPLVENCYIEANCDDSISGGSPACTIKKVLGLNKIFVQDVAFAKLAVGDRVAIFNQREGKIVAEAKITEVRAEDNELGLGQVVTLDKNVTGITCTNNKTTSDLLFTPDMTSSGFTIRNCTIAVKAGRGVFLNCQDVLVENCKFINVAGESLMLANEAPNNANGYVNNITIRHNTFTNTTYGMKNWDTWATIHVGTLRQFNPLKGDKYLYNAAEGKITGNVSITDNTFTNSSANYIYLSAVKNAVIKNNKMNTDANTLVIKNDALIIADNSQHVEISNNTINDKRSGLQYVFFAKGNTPKDDSGIKLTGNSVSSFAKGLINN